MEGGREEDEGGCCACCSSESCPWCFGACLKEKRKQKYAGIKYELMSPPQPGRNRSFFHQQNPNPAVIVPADMQRYLDANQAHRYRHRSQFVVTQQPKASSNPPGHPYYSPHVRHVEGSPPPSPTSSLSEDVPTPGLTKLRSVDHSPDPTRSDKIDISQSPTGTFSSAYQRSQRKRSNRESSTTVSSIPSALQTSSSEDTDVDTTTSSQKRHSSRTNSFSSESDPSPVVKISLYYHMQSECLSVCLHGAHNLPPKSTKAYSLNLHLAPEKSDPMELKIAGDDPNPVLAQSFEIGDVNREEIRSFKLMIRLHDSSSGGPLLGKAMVDLDKTDLFGMVIAVPLDTHNYKPKGELLVSLSYNAKASIVQGILLKVTNVTATSERGGNPGIYVKVYLVYKGKRNKQWKSTTKPSNNSLIFNEAFQFDVRGRETRKSSLEICVMSHDRFELGRVVIGEETEYEAARQHWNQIVSQPESRISHWHTFSLHGPS